MSEIPQNDGALHLPDLKITGFRGIKDLSVSRLGRVTLVAGKNGSGKTTLLEAVQVYAARGRYPVLNGLLRSREEMWEETNEYGETYWVVDWGALFHGRRITPDSHICIGPADTGQQVSIQPVVPEAEQYRYLDIEGNMADMLWIRIKFRNQYMDLPAPLNLQQFLRNRLEDFPPAVDCNRMGPDLPDNAEVARFWDSTALTDDEDLAVVALSQITDERVERVAAIGQDAGGNRRNPGRRVMVRIAGESAPVPLKSLGDGATRFFTLALALANCRNGFLVIDEVENGIHHRMQRDLWKMVLETAAKNNVQVFAATHSWDCVRGFAQAMTDLEDVDGVLVRLEQREDHTRAVEYSKWQLQVAARQVIEVR